MALFTDGDLNSLQDLERYESGLLSVTSAEQIDLSAKMALAQDLIGTELLLFLLKRCSTDYGTYAHSSCTATGRRRLGVSDVCATPPLQRWHALKTIELVYQDAYNNQLNDRYKGKWNQYQQLAGAASRSLYEIGVGMIRNPIVKAHSPILLSIAGTLDAATYYVSMTWLNSAGQEGAPSDVVALTTTTGSQLVVSPAVGPSNAVGWNVYVGETPDLTLQNNAMLPLQVDWVMPATGETYGFAPGSGQDPDYYVVDDHRIRRG